MFQPKFCPNCGGELAIEQVEHRQRPVCQSCGLIYYIDPKVAVAVIVPYGDGIVLGRRAIEPGLGAWSFPSGYVDRGEVVEEAAIREVAEEVGIEVEIEGMVGLYSTSGEPVILAVFAARVLSGRPIAGHEMTEVGIFSPNRLPAMAFSHDQRIMADWERFRNALAFTQS